MKAFAASERRQGGADRDLQGRRPLGRRPQGLRPLILLAGSGFGVIGWISLGSAVVPASPFIMLSLWMLLNSHPALVQGLTRGLTQGLVRVTGRGRSGSGDAGALPALPPPPTLVRLADTGVRPGPTVHAQGSVLLLPAPSTGLAHDQALDQVLDVVFEPVDRTGVPAVIPAAWLDEPEEAVPASDAEVPAVALEVSTLEPSTPDPGHTVAAVAPAAEEPAIEPLRWRDVFGEDSGERFRRRILDVDQEELRPVPVTGSAVVSDGAGPFLPAVDQPVPTAKPKMAEPKMAEQTADVPEPADSGADNGADSGTVRHSEPRPDPSEDGMERPADEPEEPRRHWRDIASDDELPSRRRGGQED
jgi:hypothetical protein